MIISSSLNSAVASLGLGQGAVLICRTLIYAATLYCISMVFPHGRAPRRALLPGCVVAGMGAVGMQIIVSVYLAPKAGGSVSTYGMLGAATVILLWLYLLARLISIAAFFNAALWKDHRQKDESETQ